ncbi:MAG TPA: imidazolonepropionase [bacterium]|nr:imidazolonepropionase [bacterium]
MKQSVDLLITHAAQLLTIAGNNGHARSGDGLADLGLVTDGAVAVADGVIVAAGSTAQVLDEVRPSTGSTTIDARDAVVLPGFVDPHTHLVFAGSRADEFEMRLAGATYQQIASRGGGILSTMRATRAATEDDLLALGSLRLDRMLLHGTTTVEAKSGYGLSVEDELKSLRVVHRLSALHDADLVPTFLGAHAVPPEFAGDPDGYVRLVIEEMIPAVVEEDLAEFCDVFCDVGAFNPDQSRSVLLAGHEAGLDLKIHADEMSDQGGARLASELEAFSADHLLRASEEGLRAMAESGTLGVLLPATALFLGLSYAPARRMIELQVPVAIGTDFNPGTSPTYSMPMVIALSSLGMKMTPAEALVAATINAAHAVGMAEEVGSLEPGKAADLVILEMEDYRQVAMAFGVNPVRTVIKRGRVVVDRGRLLRENQ